MGMLHKVEDVLRKSSLFMASRNVVGYAFCRQFSYLLVVTLMDMLVGILMFLIGLYGGYGVGQRNLEGRMLLEYCLQKEVCVSNT